MLLHLNIINDLLNSDLSPRLLLLLEIAIKHGSIDARVELVSVEGVAHTVRELVKHLPVIQLDVVFYEVPHAIVLAQVSKFSQFLAIFRNSVTLSHLVLKLELFLALVLELVQLLDDKDLKVDGFFALALPLAHVCGHILEIFLNFLHFITVNAVDEVQQFSLHFLVLGLDQLFYIARPPLLLLFMRLVRFYLQLLFRDRLNINNMPNIMFFCI